jgi:hypothetical protein
MAEFEARLVDPCSNRALLMTAQHQRFDRQQQRLDAKKQGVHQADSINGMQHEAPKRTCIL